ncbi:hypothetical protein I4F81_008953 [Pyropia yezoensis]|uniref:Uncharacterized protein n=1 Tax=Pyropia yezoensis TaxID=2788 RepID=A0ACC3C9J3_PYRYE|nr:hypothetical protein I4F81_008953 [Neopyropia yezoensis]
MTIAAAACLLIMAMLLFLAGRPTFLRRLAQQGWLPRPVREAVGRLLDCLDAEAARVVAASSGAATAAAAGSRGAPGTRGGAGGAAAAGGERRGAKVAALISARYAISPRGCDSGADGDGAEDGDGGGGGGFPPLGDDWTCSICLEGGDASVSGVHSVSLLSQLPCSHAFHSLCLQEWLSRGRRPTCPCCNADVAALGVALLSVAELPLPLAGAEEGGEGDAAGGAAGHGGGRGEEGHHRSRWQRGRSSARAGAAAAVAAAAAAADVAVMVEGDADTPSTSPSTAMPSRPPAVARSAAADADRAAARDAVAGSACFDGWCT